MESRFACESSKLLAHQPAVHSTTYTAHLVDPTPPMCPEAAESHFYLLRDSPCISWMGARYDVVLWKDINNPQAVLARVKRMR